MLAQALEHELLLTLLVPADVVGDDVEGEEGGSGAPSTVGGPRGFRFRVTPGYEPLPAARQKASESTQVIVVIGAMEPFGPTGCCPSRSMQWRAEHTAAGISSNGGAGGSHAILCHSH